MRKLDTDPRGSLLCALLCACVVPTSACDGGPTLDGGSAPVDASEPVDSPTATPITFVLETSELIGESPVSGATLWFFEDGIVRDACGPGCGELTTDAAGRAAVTALPGASYAYRVLAGTYADPTGAEISIVDSTGVGARTPSSTAAIETAPVASASTANTIHALYMRSRTPGRATIVGRAVDALGAPAAGRTVRILAAGAELPMASCPTCDGITLRYSTSFGVSATEADGSFVVLDVPVDAPVRIESAVAGEPEGCQDAPVLGDGVTFADVRAGTCGP